MSYCEIRLRKMTIDEYESFMKISNENHAEELLREKNITQEGALRETEAGLEKMLPNGLETSNNYLMVIERLADSTIVGYMWYMYDDRRADTFLFLCDFLVYENERRKGYAQQALAEMEEAGRELSCKKCVLFVRDDNNKARKLYEKCGYIYRNERDSGRYMDKDI